MLNINLLPWREIERSRARKQKKVVWLSVIVLFFISIFIMQSILFHHPVKKENKHRMKKTPEKIALKWVGYLKSEHEFLGLLQSTSGKIQRVKVGSVIGEARVLRITEEGLTILNNRKEEWIGRVV